MVSNTLDNAFQNLQGAISDGQFRGNLGPPALEIYQHLCPGNFAFPEAAFQGDPFLAAFIRGSDLP